MDKSILHCQVGFHPNQYRKTIIILGHYSDKNAVIEAFQGWCNTYMRTKDEAIADAKTKVTHFTNTVFQIGMGLSKNETFFFMK